MTEQHDNEHHQDDWFRHTPDEPDAQTAHGEVKPFIILGFLATVIVITFAVIGLFLVYFDQTFTDMYGQRNEQATDRYLASEKNTAFANWNETLNQQTPQWQSMEEGFVTLPIDRAQSAVLDMYSNADNTND